MRINNFYKVSEIIFKLSSYEYKALLRSLNIYGNKRTIILRKEIVKFIRGNGSNYNALVSRFSNNSEKKLNSELGKILKILKESTIQEEVLKDTLRGSELFKEKFRLLKDIPFIMMIRKNGNFKESSEMIDKNIEQARIYELYSELLIYLQMKLDVLFINVQSQGLNEVLDEIRITERHNRAIRNSTNAYEYYMAQALNKGYTDLQSVLKSSLKQINLSYKLSGSRRVLMNLYLIQMEEAIVYHRYEYGYEIGMKMLDLLLTNKHLCSRNRVSQALSYLAHNQLCYLDFSSAIEFGDLCSSFQDKDSLSYISTADFITRSQLFSLDYVNAKGKLDEVLSLNSLSSFPFYESKFNYYQAMLYFTQNNFDACWRVLSMHFELEKDKEGWRVWLSIMRIICQIERKQYIDVEMQIQSFKKYIQRWEQKAEIKERDKLIFSIIECLNKKNFDFIEVSEVLKNKIDSLRQTSGSVRWEPNSPELILFHDWFDSKANNKAYLPHFEPYRKANKPQNSNNYLADIQRVKDLSNIE